MEYYLVTQFSNPTIVFSSDYSSVEINLLTSHFSNLHLCFTLFTADIHAWCSFDKRQWAAHIPINKSIGHMFFLPSLLLQYRKYHFWQHNLSALLHLSLSYILKDCDPQIFSIFLSSFSFSLSPKCNLNAQKYKSYILNDVSQCLSWSCLPFHLLPPSSVPIPFQSKIG